VPIFDSGLINPLNEKKTHVQRKYIFFPEFLTQILCKYLSFLGKFSQIIELMSNWLKYYKKLHFVNDLVNKNKYKHIVLEKKKKKGIHKLPITFKK
jgi:hypothetical protein